MRVIGQVQVADTGGTLSREPAAAAVADWAEQTRRVLTRDLLVRASCARHGESQALRFRALHLNLPLVAEVADRLGLPDADRARAEHAALDGLLEAVGQFDPYGEAEFAPFAVPFIVWRIRAAVRPADPPPPRRRPGSVLTISRRRDRPTRR